MYDYTNNIKIAHFYRRQKIHCEWRDEKSFFFGILKRKAGYYTKSGYYINSELEEYYIDENKNLYSKSYVVVYFFNIDCSIIYFNDNKEINDVYKYLCSILNITNELDPVFFY